MDATNGGCRLLYFVKSNKNGTIDARIVLFYCVFVNTFILLHFLRWQEGPP